MIPQVVIKVPAKADEEAARLADLLDFHGIPNRIERHTHILVDTREVMESLTSFAQSTLVMVSVAWLQELPLDWFPQQQQEG